MSAYMWNFMWNYHPKRAKKTCQNTVILTKFVMFEGLPCDHHVCRNYVTSPDLPSLPISSSFTFTLLSYSHSPLHFHLLIFSPGWRFLVLVLISWHASEVTPLWRYTNLFTIIIIKAQLVDLSTQNFIHSHRCSVSPMRGEKTSKSSDKSKYRCLRFVQCCR